MLERAPEHWEAVRNRLEQGITRITSRPALGRRRSDLVGDRYRFYLVHPYFLIFEHGKRGVVITRILHSARDIASILGDD